MDFRRILVTGGAGFVGSSLALGLKERHSSCEVIACDNLRRRGSELNLARLRDHGVDFRHADVRCPRDFDEIPAPDLVVDCAAEPSVLAGVGGSPAYVVEANLAGTVHSLELARRPMAAFLFLSTSRVYPIAVLNSLRFREAPTRFEWEGSEELPGFSAAGVAEDFPLAGARSIYGATKLAGELLVEEYAACYGLPALINRCGVVSGPWQMARSDQGVVALWVARHDFGGSLTFKGYGGSGKQVRDVLHVADLSDLVLRQVEDLSRWDGRAYNVGGGQQHAVSLLELTSICREVTGKSVALRREPETSAVDVRIFITDSSRAERDFGWSPRRGVPDCVADIHRWLLDHQSVLQHVVG
jgi:CDP-paratose 2-epimerase